MDKSLSLNFESLDTLRGVLATYIVVGHCCWLLWAPANELSQYPNFFLSIVLPFIHKLLSYPFTAAMIFFTLSGFFIHLRVSKQLVNNQNFRFNTLAFIKHRCHRLLPPYFLALTLTVVFDLIGQFFYPTLYHIETPNPFINKQFSNFEFSLSSVVPALIMLPSSLGKSFGSNGVLWFIAYQTMYYLFYPLWLKIRRFGALPAYFSVLLLAVIAHFLLPQCFIKRVFLLYPIWLTGAMLSEIVLRKSLSKSITALSFLCSIITLTVIYKFDIRFSVCVYVILSMSIVLTMVTISKKICKYRIHRFFKALGMESYSVYICHFPIVTFISAWVFEVLGKQPIEYYLMVGGAAISLFFCHLCFLICERHFSHPRLTLQ